MDLCITIPGKPSSPSILLKAFFKLASIKFEPGAVTTESGTGDGLISLPTLPAGVTQLTYLGPDTEATPDALAIAGLTQNTAYEAVASGGMFKLRIPGGNFIDFTAPEATLAFAELAAQARAVHVIGTTGMTDEQLARLEPASRHAVIVQAGNMSLGVNLLTGLTRKIAAALDEDFDIEVVEAHHHHKVDAPSGTALMLGEAAAEGRGVKLSDVSDRGRDGITGARKRGDIGFTAIRGGDIVGEHDVIFAGAGERIIIRHVATDRGIFARGALRAALWGQDKAPGRYDMNDVLGL